MLIIMIVSLLCSLILFGTLAAAQSLSKKTAGMTPAVNRMYIFLYTLITISAVATVVLYLK